MTSRAALLACLLFSVSVTASDTKTQEELDAACEAARQAKIEPAREHYIQECIEEQGKTEEYCRRFYADYGERSGNRPAMFYDLPECEAAFANKRSGR